MNNFEIWTCGFADPEILEIMSESVYSQLKEIISISKTTLNNSLNKFGLALPQETLAVLLRHPQYLKEKQVPQFRKKVTENKKHLDKVHMGFVWREQIFLSITPLIERYLLRLSTNIDKDSELAEKTLNGDFPELRNRLPLKAQTHKKNPAESSTVNKKPLFLKNKFFLQGEKQLRYLFNGINLDISVYKIAFYPSDSLKISPIRIYNYNLIDNYASEESTSIFFKQHYLLK